MIPKIIHQMAPANINKWNYFWHECHQSWKDKFNDFEHVMWTDEKVFELVETSYPEYYEMFKSFSHNIIRWDFARFCILHKFGGIYADMDIYCYKNFYDFLTEDIYVVESWPEFEETIQNSLMASIPNHKFWEKCMSNVKTIEKNKSDINYYIKNFCGPIYISNFSNEVNLLPKKIFNPQCEFPNIALFNKYININNKISMFNNVNKREKNVITRHWLTGDWGIKK